MYQQTREYSNDFVARLKMSLNQNRKKMAQNRCNRVSPLRLQLSIVLQLCIPVVLLAFASAATETTSSQQQAPAAPQTQSMTQTIFNANSKPTGVVQQQQQVTSVGTGSSNSELGQQMVSSSSAAAASQTTPQASAIKQQQPQQPPQQPIQQQQQQQQQQQLKLPKINLYVSENESKKLLGITKRIEYVTNGNVNTYPFLFAIPLGYNQADTIFTWQNLAQTNVNYSISLAISNIQAVDPPLINITRAGLIPRQEQVFKITLPCSGKLTDEVDVQILINIVGTLDSTGSDSAPLDNADNEDSRAEPPLDAQDESPSSTGSGKSRARRTVSHQLAIKRKKLCLANSASAAAASPVQVQQRPATSVWPPNSPQTQMHQSSTQNQPNQKRISHQSNHDFGSLDSSASSIVPAHSASFNADQAETHMILQQQQQQQQQQSRQQQSNAKRAQVSVGAPSKQQASSQQHASYPNWPTRIQQQQQVSPEPSTSHPTLNELLMQVAPQRTPFNEQQPQPIAPTATQSQIQPAAAGALLVLFALLVALLLVALALLAANQRRPFDKLNSLTSRLLSTRASRNRARNSHATHTIHRTNNATGGSSHLDTKQRAMFAPMLHESQAKLDHLDKLNLHLGQCSTTAADLIASSLRNGPLKSSTTIDLRTHSPAQHSHHAGSGSSPNASIAKFAAGSAAHNCQQQQQQHNKYACYNQSIYSMCPSQQQQQQPPTADLLGTGYQCQSSASSNGANSKQLNSNNNNNNNNQYQVYHVGLPNNSQTTRLVWHPTPQASSSSIANGSYTIERSQQQQQQNNYTSINYSLNERSDNGSVYQTIY